MTLRGDQFQAVLRGIRDDFPPQPAAVNAKAAWRFHLICHQCRRCEKMNRPAGLASRGLAKAYRRGVAGKGPPVPLYANSSIWSPLPRCILMQLHRKHADPVPLLTCGDTLGDWCDGRSCAARWYAVAGLVAQVIGADDPEAHSLPPS
jgi:hypothetical protein